MLQQNIYKKELVSIISKDGYIKEVDFQNDLIKKLVDLLKVKPNQINSEKTTTPFDWKLSERADIVISSTEKFKQTLVVFELKLSGSVNKYQKGDYSEVIKKLHKYCQDLKSPFGVLLVDNGLCQIFKYSHRILPSKPTEITELPNLNKIEEDLGLEAVKSAIFHPRSDKYILGTIFIFGILYISIFFIYRLLF